MNTIKHHLLVVDDEPDCRELIVLDLEEAGFKVSEASSGRQALEVVRKERIDLIISDVRMDNGDGIELLREVKRTVSNYPQLLFLTAYSDISNEEAYKLGAVAVLAKPVAEGELLTAIGGILNDIRGA